MAHGIDRTGSSASENVVAFAQRQVDRVVSADTRKRAYDQGMAVASARPMLFSFVLANVVFSALPLLAFAAFALSTVAFALGAALLFALFWIGVAFLVLVPVLFVTTSVAVLVWLWAAVTLALVRWGYDVAAPTAQRAWPRAEEGKGKGNGKGEGGRGGGKDEGEDEDGGSELAVKREEDQDDVPKRYEHAPAFEQRYAPGQ